MEMTLCNNLRSTQPLFPGQIPLLPSRRISPATLVTSPGIKTVAMLTWLAPVAATKKMEAPAMKEEEKEEEEVEEELMSAEILECLEREAIMGEDEGREPRDYNRRAQIFDKSSRVFQALKERTIIGDDNHGDK